MRANLLELLTLCIHIQTFFLIKILLPFFARQSSAVDNVIKLAIEPYSETVHEVQPIYVSAFHES